MNQMVFISLLSVLGVMFIWIGLRSKDSTSSLSEFFLGGRKLGFFSLAMTLLATQLGGGTLLGAAEEAYRGGWWVLCYPLGYVFAFIIMSCGFGARLRRLELFTLAEVFERGYNSPALRKVGSAFSIISLFLVLIALGIAMRKFLIALGFTSPLYSLGIWTVVIGYTAMGGLKAVVKTDVIQAAFIVAIVLAGAAMTWWQISCGHVVGTGVATPFESDGTLPWVGWLLMPMLFVLIEQDMAQRYFAVKSPKMVPAASMLAALLLFVASGAAIAYGVLAREIGIEIPEGASVLMTTIQATTSPVMMAVIACGILLAIISTADSLLCSISSNMAMDFLVVRVSAKRGVVVAQIVTAVTGLCAVGLSFSFDSVVGMMVQAYELSVFSLLWPVVFAVMRGKGEKLSAVLAIVCGLIGALLFRFIEIPYVPREVACLLFSLVGYCVGDLITAPAKEVAANES